MPFAVADQLVRQAGRDGASVLESRPDQYTRVGLGLLEALEGEEPVAKIWIPTCWVSEPT